jgi:Flp pilus assembly protein TadG
MRFAIVRLLIEMRSTLACRRGQVVIIFAFAVLMLVLAIGTGIDMWQGFVVKSRLQSAVDAAALAIASTNRTI